MSKKASGIGRRNFIAGTGGLMAAPLLWNRGETEHTSQLAAISAEVPPDVLPEQTCDLTMRWRQVASRIADDTLVAAWPMDEGSGFAMVDASGHGHDLYITGAEWNTTNSGLVDSFRRFGRRGGGVFLDGTQWLQAQDLDDLNVSASGATLSAWVRPESMPSGVAFLVRHGDAYALSLTDQGRIRLSVRGGNGETRVVASATGAVSAGRWAHVIASVNPATGNLALYINGDAAARESVAPFTPAGTAEDLLVGERLHGSLDEVVIHGRALGEAGVRNLYLVGLPKLYTQSRETIDAEMSEWTRFKGEEPIPHPLEPDTVFAVRFDGDGTTVQGNAPVAGNPVIVPGHFGGALQATTGTGIAYASPITTAAGTFEAWYKTVADSSDPARLARKELFRAEGADQTWLSVYTEDGGWKAAIGTADSTTNVVEGPRQKFVTGLLEHVAVSWGSGALVIYVNGSDVARGALDEAPPSYDQRLVIGGGSAPAYCQIDDVHVSNAVRTWGEICPRGHTATDTAGLDLRDSFHRAAGTPPMWWRPGSADSRWEHATKTWEDPSITGDGPTRNRALRPSSADGVHLAFHPDAYGNASSIEAGVSFAATPSGWAGVFVQATAPGETFSGHTLAINPATGRLRLARHANGTIAESKVIGYDFPTKAETTYELTLTAAGNGQLRGYVDGQNVISMPLDGSARANGFAGLYTEGAEAYFDDIHFTALTPARQESRRVQVRLFSTGGEIADADVQLSPFRWHKRRGLVPWEYIAESGDQPGNPELAGNIAGADTPVPERPIGPAFWRSEDSANSDLITVDGRVIYFMRGNPRVDEHSYGARIGVLDTTVDRFDGVHFDDPSQGIDDLDQCKLVRGRDDPLYPDLQNRTPHLQVNNSGSAYVGDGRVLVFMNETRGAVGDYPSYRVLAYAHYDARANDWVHSLSQYVDWSTMDPGDPNAEFEGLFGTPELVSLRDAETDEYRVVLFHLSVDEQTGVQSMTTTGLFLDADGVPQLDPDMPSTKSLARRGTDADGRDRATKPIYNFRVLFDNGIYYLHYSEGPRVPDWPTHFPLCAAIDPYQGPWVRNEATNDDDATYFTRGGEFEPDNAAIWQGAMVKLRGRYYMYYENFHAIDDINAPYQYYDDPHVGSRVGYSIAN